MAKLKIKMVNMCSESVASKKKHCERSVSNLIRQKKSTWIMQGL